MQVFGDLIVLPKNRKQIPLPWHCRAPLGLEHGSTVHVSLVRAEQGEGAGLSRLPDVVATVLHPERWDTTWTMRIRPPDTTGLLWTCLDELRRLAFQCGVEVNIALGETATLGLLEGGHVERRRHHAGEFRPEAKDLSRVHEICVIVEVIPPAPGAEGFVQKFKEELEAKRWWCEVERFGQPGERLKYLQECRVSHGIVELTESWQEAMEGFVSKEAMAGFDLNQAAITADLRSRVIRLVIPKAGARRLVTRHADQPNVLVKITESVRASNYSILCSHLRKGAGTNSATFVAVCEPHGEAVPETLECAAEELETSDPLVEPEKQLISRAKVYPARGTQDSLFPKLRAGELVSQVWTKVNDAPDDFDELLRANLLRSTLDLYKLPAINTELLEAAARRRDQVQSKRQLVVYLRTGWGGWGGEHESDHLDRYLKLVIMGDTIELIDGDQNAATHSGGKPGGAGMATRAMDMIAADVGVFVLRQRRSATNGSQVNYQPLQELAIFHLLNGASKRSLLLVDQGVTGRGFAKCEDWGRACTEERYVCDVDDLETLPQEERDRRLGLPDSPGAQLWRWINR